MFLDDWTDSDSGFLCSTVVCMYADWITCCTVMEVDEMGYLCAARGC